MRKQVAVDRKQVGVDPYPGGVQTPREYIEAGELREEIPLGLKKAQAIEKGRALVERLKGTGWRLRVWQNLGWHYGAVNGPLMVNATTTSVSRPRVQYWCSMAEGYRNGWPEGAHLGTGPNLYAADPNKAVRMTVDRARKYVLGLNRTMTLVRNRLGV